MTMPATQWLTSVLAQTGGATGAPAPSSAPLASAGPNPLSVFEEALRSRLDVLAQPEALVQSLSVVHPVWASIFLVLGGVSLLQGWRWRRGVLLVLAALLGVGLGQSLGARVGEPAIVSIAFAVLFAVAALPLMRFTVALFAGLAGAFAGANCWTALGADPSMHQFGALLGFVAMGMLAFVAYRAVIIAFTSIGGASLLAVGALALMLQVDAWRPSLEGALMTHPQMVPLLAAVAAATGMLLQEVGCLGGVKAVAEAAEKGPAAKAQAKAA